MPDVLIYGDTVRSPELRHEVPLTIPDGFLYVEHGGSRHVVISGLEVPRIRELGGGARPTPSLVEEDLHAWRLFMARPPADWVQPRHVERTAAE